MLNRLKDLVASMTKQKDGYDPDGKTERVDIKVPIKGAAIIAFGGKVTPTLTREFYEKRRGMQLLNVALMLVGALVGLLFAGWAGVAAGILIGVANYFVGPLAIIKVREIERFR